MTLLDHTQTEAPSPISAGGDEVMRVRKRSGGLEPVDVVHLHHVQLVVGLEGVDPGHQPDRVGLVRDGAPAEVPVVTRAARKQP